MAPNIRLALKHDSEENNSREEFLDQVQPLPRLLHSHQPHHFQDQDSPNLHQSPHHRHTARGRGQAKTFPSSRAPATALTNRSLRPSNPSAGVLEEKVRNQPNPFSLREGTGIDVNLRNSQTRFNGRGPTRDAQGSPTITVGTRLPSTTKLPSASNKPSSSPGVSRNPPTISRIPATRIPGRVPAGAIQHSTKDIPALESGAAITTQVLRSSTHPPPPPSKSIPGASSPPLPPPPTTTSKAITRSHLDRGVLKLPGHEPEAPADLVLIHHDRAINTHNQTGLDGIFVRDDSTTLTPEAATALILIGLCSIFLVFICLIMFVQKVRRQRIDRKVVQDMDGMKPQPTYETMGIPATYQPNPLSFLPPDVLHALMQPIATKPEIPEEPKPSFLTMEPPQPGNQLGRLWFSVHYDYVKATLVLHILHARYVKGRGSSTNPGNVWVEACVLTPMNTIKASNKTDTRRASLAPVFNQSFNFMVEDEEVTQFLLRLTLYDNHPQNGEKAVGSVIVPLNTVDLCSNETISRDLQ